MKCSHFDCRDIRGIRVPEYCQNEAVTFHGVMTVSHGYCAQHRCCGICGGQIIRTTGAGCTCKAGPTERPEYVQWLELQMLIPPDQRSPSLLAIIGSATKGPIGAPINMTPRRKKPWWVLILDFILCR